MYLKSSIHIFGLILPLNDMLDETEEDEIEMFLLLLTDKLIDFLSSITELFILCRFWILLCYDKVNSVCLFDACDE